MLKNNKGFSIIELLAVVAIMSALLVPLLTSFNRNLELNRVQHTKRSALAISKGSLYAFDKLDFADIRTLLDAANLAGTDYIEFNETNCTNLAGASDQALCLSVFTSIHNNLVLDSTTFRIFMFDYNLDAPTKAGLVGNGAIPQEARDEINALAITDGSITNLIRIVVWIYYETDPVDHHFVISGVIDNE